ncbi:5-oxoprolinase subunit PxpA [Oceanicoccus sp. KOV_DT_Chl]|uniref:5-oxoprolinase subunit PxpA n=1 Tax=Oceanicoccus sp. KOV_DT_Chl TaxID=1904639 RepID=UPI000C7D2734|nr:5-oxoprolinase subunit PxpA [Oceanicoccus sp. KOV_DT_Chl]
MLLNCDLGEFESDEIDAAVMPYIDQANIACGFHAGNEHTMLRTLQLAKKYGVHVGAHPSYPDRENFGRRSMDCSRQQITDLIHQQLNLLKTLADSLAVTVSYVKPHGALYNDMMSNADLRSAVMAAVAEYPALLLMLQATPENQIHQQEAAGHGITLLFEAFADRCYTDDGLLLARSNPAAVHNQQKTLQQVQQLCQHNSVTSLSGQALLVDADSLCVHGDNQRAVKVISEIKQLVDGLIR